MTVIMLTIVMMQIMIMIIIIALFISRIRPIRCFIQRNTECSLALGSHVVNAWVLGVLSVLGGVAVCWFLLDVQRIQQGFGGSLVQGQVWWTTVEVVEENYFESLLHIYLFLFLFIYFCCGTVTLTSTSDALSACGKVCGGTGLVSGSCFLTDSSCFMSSEGGVVYWFSDSTSCGSGERSSLLEPFNALSSCRSWLLAGCQLQQELYYLECQPPYESNFSTELRVEDGIATCALHPEKTGKQQEKMKGMPRIRRHHISSDDP